MTDTPASSGRRPDRSAFVCLAAPLLQEATGRRRETAPDLWPPGWVRASSCFTRWRF